MEKQQFYVLKDAEGVYRPAAFITPIDENGAGDIRKEMYETKLEDGESIVVVSFTEVV